MQQLQNLSIEQNISKTKKIAEKQDFKGQIYISITDFHSIQKDQYHHPQKETHILWP